MPPLPLANRVGSLAEAEDPYAFYEQVGAECREQILRMLPAGYELEGRRLLDFGCGAGRTLRHFLDQADSAEIWGCDIDAESIDWLQRNLCPPLHALRNEAEPGLPFAGRPLRRRLGALGVHPPGGHLGGLDAGAPSGPRRRRDPDRDHDRPPPFGALRQGGLGGGPHRHERASSLGLMGGRRASGPSLDLVAACPLGPRLRDPRDRRVAGGRGADQRRLYLVRVHEPSLACDAKARPRPHRRGPRAPRARRAARAQPPCVTTSGSCGASSTSSAPPRTTPSDGCGASSIGPRRRTSNSTPRLRLGNVRSPAYRDSASWRVTAPGRWLGQWLRRLLRRGGSTRSGASAGAA